MAALISLFMAIAISLLITRVAAEALTLTGLSRESAEFQARSAFTGAGFTTSESEQVVSHPVRRRILMWLMLLGNAGIITVISSLILTFVGTKGAGDWSQRIVVLILGLILISIVATNRRFSRYLSKMMHWALKRWTHLDVRDYASLLRLSGNYAVMEMQVDAEDWIANKPLCETHLRQEGILVLGIQRLNGHYVGAPKGGSCIFSGDILILYGRLSTLNELDSRKQGMSGEEAHQQAVATQAELLAHEQQEELNP
ncbi:MAG: potassium transporter TrkA [Symploca sp. SIO1B1]|nr:potassium transporter TrkA [Symploca sp. SIO1A3]NES00164.1 potassium transporter TrkA [Symploca sp. SIO1B1]